MSLLLLRPGWPSDRFLRTVRGPNGESETLAFPKGVPVDVPGALIPDLAEDLGAALVRGVVDAAGHVRAVPFTDAELADARKAHAERIDADRARRKAAAKADKSAPPANRTPTATPSPPVPHRKPPKDAAQPGG